MTKGFDVIIIGGGITGVGIARDCSLRGLRTLLLEKGDLTNGATGRNHGLLHSGARYAVTDPVSAAECISENRILRRIASNCVDPTGGLFISLPEDDPSFRKTFIDSCRSVGIDARQIDPKEALRMEPGINPHLTGAVLVPDASVDPFRLTTENAVDAVLHGAEIRTYVEVTGFLRNGTCVEGVEMRDINTGEVSRATAGIVVNAAGIWGSRILSLAGIGITMFPAKGSLLVFGHRVNRMVINRCRKPSDADILVPGEVVSIIGTVSSKVPFEECDDIRVSFSEARQLLEGSIEMCPSLAGTRILRAYAGVRPLVSADEDSSGRNISRGMVLLDHEKRDGVSGLVTIAGGKLTSYRLMAEKTTDLVCAKLGVDRKSRTAFLPLPGSGEIGSEDYSGIAFKAARFRHGARIAGMDFKDKSEVICECEHVTRAEIEYAVAELGVRNLVDLRRRSRVGMGTCQGTFCINKVATVLAEVLGCPEKAPEFVRQFIQERWKGMVPVCWGESLREAEYMRKKYGNEI